MEIRISADIKNINPSTSLGFVEARCNNSEHNDSLWLLITAETIRIRQMLSFDEIKNLPAVAATRGMYSACGKDPSRYRPSAEALMRRIVKGQDLYQINTLVDIINFISLKTGFSIGGFDVSKIQGNVEAGIGRPDELYHAIGRGLLNIENLPVLRDEKGAIGSPTSDEERTSIGTDTIQILLVFYDFGSPEELPVAMNMAKELLKHHAGAELIKLEIVH